MDIWLFSLGEIKGLALAAYQYLLTHPCMFPSLPFSFHVTNQSVVQHS